jgi:hypothetical protein
MQGLMLGGEHWGMVSLFVPWDVLFQTAMKHNLFFTCRNSLEVLFPLIPLGYHMCQHQAFRVPIELGSLMRVVVMGLQMGMILFIQEDHPSDGSSFPSTSTYLQSKSSWCPSVNSQGLRVSLSHIWPTTHLFSHGEVVWSQGSMGIISVPWPPVGLHLSDGRNFHTLGNPNFPIMMDL